MKHGAIHDFSGKLRQPSLAAHLQTYVEWRRAVAEARSAGKAALPTLDLAPISINLDLTTACNFRCTHCIDWDILNTRDKHREPDLRDQLKHMAEHGLRSVILIGGGEPTLFPRFADFVGFLKGLGLAVAIVTNGSRGHVLVEAAAHLDDRDWIRLSLDSGSNELFARMHAPVDPKLDLDAICAWIPKIKAANPSVRVGFSYIIVWGGATRGEHAIHENIHEIFMATERAKRSGFDYIALKPVLERQGDGAEVMDPMKAELDIDRAVARIRAEVDRAKGLADARFQVHESINLRVLEQGNWSQLTRQPRTCHMQALRQVLSPTGIYNCPAHRGVEKARIAGPSAPGGGEVAGKQGAQLLRILDEFDASEECREVTCLYNSVNWWIEKMVQDPSLELDIEPERSDHFL